MSLRDVQLGDISLRVSPAIRWSPEKLTASAGLMQADAETQPGYATGAWVPRPPWQPVDVLRVDRRGGSGRRPRTVGLVSVAADLLERLRSDAHGARSAGSLAHFAAELCAGVSGEWTIATAPRSLSLGRSPPGLATVTRDPVTGAFVGLHVDSFHANYDECRAAVGNRISVNIGTDPRFFLFIPLSFRALFMRAGRPAGRTDVVASFMAANPGQPVLRLRVDPGEAYIAPTESIAHDASSLGAAVEDLHVTGRGVLDPRPC